MTSSMASITSVVLALLLLLVEPSSSTQVKFDLHGNVHPEGHIYVTVKIGEPAREYNLDVDTGSILTWLQCHDPNCRGQCKKWPHPYYELTPDKPVSRNYPLCHRLPQDPFFFFLRNQDPAAPHDQKCRRMDYGIGYSRGLLIRHKFTVPSLQAPHLIAFGCGYDNSPIDATPVDGILALGRGSSVSMISQLKKERVITKDVAIHCISTIGGGFLQFGDYEQTSSPITWVDMDRNAVHGYTPISRAVLRFGSSKGALISKDTIRVIFDSGSTFTYIDENIYQQIENKVTTNLHRSLTRVHGDPTMMLCWKGPKKFKSIYEVKPLFQSIFLDFGQQTGGPIMEIPPENYLIISHGYNNVCFGVLSSAKSQGRTLILGAITMQDRIVIYDNERSKIGWAHHLC